MAGVLAHMGLKYLKSLTANARNDPDRDGAMGSAGPTSPVRFPYCHVLEMGQEGAGNTTSTECVERLPRGVPTG
jgi:hypothetical protein